MFGLLSVLGFAKDAWAYVTQHWKMLLLVGGLIAVLVGVTVGAYNLAKAMSKQQIEAIKEVSEKAGRTEANLNTMKEAQARMEQQMTEINRRLDETNQRFDEVRVENQKAQKTINSYDAKGVAKTQGPKVVEDWANKTNNDLFKDVQKEANQ
jgi:TolA-binding protein